MSQDEKVAQLTSLTGLQVQEAEFFLESCGGDVEAALNTYLETQNQELNCEREVEETTEDIPQIQASEISEKLQQEKFTMTDKQSNSSGQQRNRRGGIATLRDLLPEEPSPEDESGKNYYAGGERSGQMIQDPRGPSREPEDLTKRIFEKARQGAASGGEDLDFSNRQRFTGAGYRLGETEADSGSQPAVVGRKNIVKTLTFYRNGFQVDDGPLRSFDDPANQQFLREVESGYVPREMEEPGMGNVSINLIDKKDEEYVVPKPKVQPFTGKGYRLTEGNEQQASSSVRDSSHLPEEAPPSQFDPNRPATSIQIRLHDGTRLIGKFNEDQTLGDIRRFVSAARRLPANVDFDLSLQFPRQILTDDGKTISELGLKGSVILQTLR
eukprot:jgi/Galph1/5215/GphlegSOOS_G3867.1